MKTKLFFVTALMLLPVFAFGQDLYDDLYSKPGKNASFPAQSVKSAAQKADNSENDNQYKIESTRVGDKDIVVVKNLQGDTVYYSGDNKDARIDSTKATLSAGEYASRIQRFHNPGTIILNGTDEEDAAPLDNVNWTINVYGGNYGAWGWPYGGYRHYPYGYGGIYSPWYSSWYGTSWDLDLGYGWGFGWDYPYYYGGYYGGGYPYYAGWGGYYGGGYPYYGGWYGGRTRPYAYTTEGRRNALNLSGGSRGTVVSSRSSGLGSRSGSPAFNSTTTGTRGNSIGTRGDRQNTAFWNGFLSNRGYNVGGSRSSGADVSGSTPQYNNRGSYSGGGSRRSSEIVSVPSSSGNYIRSNETRSSSRNNTAYYNNTRSSSSSSYDRPSSNSNSNSSSYSSGSRQSYSGGSSSYSSGGGSYSGGGSRGGGRR